MHNHIGTSAGKGRKANLSTASEVRLHLSRGKLKTLLTMHAPKADLAYVWCLGLNKESGASPHMERPDASGSHSGMFQGM